MNALQFYSINLIVLKGTEFYLIHHANDTNESYCTELSCGPVYYVV